MRSETNDPTGAGAIDPADRIDPGDPLAQLHTLPTSIEPEHDLWPEIEARIERGASSSNRTASVSNRTASASNRINLAPWLGRLALAASLLAALALGWTLATRAGSAPMVVEVPAPTPAPAASGVERTAYAATGRELDAIRDELRRSIESRRDQLPPATRKLVFDNLATIEKAIGEIESALAAEPADQELARTYIVYRQRQIDLLRQANRLASRL